MTLSPKISLHHFLAHKEVLRLQYDHYGACVSEHHMIRVTALLQPTDQDNIILQEVNIPLKMPALHIKVIKGIVHRNIKKLSYHLFAFMPSPMYKAFYFHLQNKHKQRKIIHFSEPI